MDQVTNAIAVVGVYFALMAVLAVGVEAVINWFKIPIPWLQGKPSAEDVLKEVKDWLPAEKEDSLEARIKALNKFLDAIGEKPIVFDDGISLVDIVERIGSGTTKHIEKDRLRLGMIRLIAVILGISLAAIFQVDTLQLLEPLYEPAQRVWLQVLGTDGAHLVGVVLSGLAASAGSSFWHDQSARLRYLKKVSRSVP